MKPKSKKKTTTNFKIMLKLPIYDYLTGEFKVKEYMSIKSTNSEKEVNGFISEGWELIDKEKSVDHYTNGENVKYILGFSYQKRVDELVEIIDAFEKYGLKEDLFKKIAEENDEDYGSIIKKTSWFGTEEDKPKTAEFMEWFEKTLNGLDVNYGFKRDQNSSESDIDDDLEF
jgi:hypothetical protein